MSNADETNNKMINDDIRGEVKIAEDVIAVIAGIAATDVKGVKGTASSIPSELANKIGVKTAGRGVKTVINDGEVEVEIALIVNYGYNIMDVSDKVQERVKNSIQNMTGFSVTAVNVKIAGVVSEQ